MNYFEIEIGENNVEKINWIPAERQNQILEYIDFNKSAQISELAMYFHVSEATVRRDLDELAHGGKIERTHGGAISIARESTSFERLYSEKVMLMPAEKQRIALSAAALVKAGDTLLLDSGTTTLFLAQKLEQIENLTVITYDLHIADTINLHSSSTMIVTGGVRRGNDFHSLQGHMVDDFISKVNVNIAFMGADAVSVKRGYANANLQEVNAKRKALEISSTKVLLADHTKFGKAALVNICGIEAFDYIISDKGLDESTAKEIQDMGVELILA